VTLTLTAENGGALVTDTHRVSIKEVAARLYLPLVLRGW
jgi:hypothetical protein